MDKKSLTGLVLIGLIFALFTIINQPSEKEQKELAKREAEKKQREADKKEMTAKTKTAVNKVKSASNKTENKVKEEVFYRIENDKLIIDLSSKGGKVAAVYLKEYESYKDFKER